MDRLCCALFKNIVINCDLLPQINWTLMDDHYDFLCGLERVFGCKNFFDLARVSIDLMLRTKMHHYAFIHNVEDNVVL